MPTGIYKHKKLSEEVKLKISLSNIGKHFFKHTEEAKRKIGQASLGNQYAKGSKPNSTSFKKGEPSPRKGIRGMMKHTEETKIKMKESAKRGNKNHQWKGDLVTYVPLHTWVARCLEKPTKCEHCGKDGLTGQQIHWANKDHKYKRNLKDWIRLCSSCHKKYDNKYIKII